MTSIVAICLQFKVGFHYHVPLWPFNILFAPVAVIGLVFSNMFQSGTKNVINACRECGVKRLIYNSSADVVYDGDESSSPPWKVCCSGRASPLFSAISFLFTGCKHYY